MQVGFAGLLTIVFVVLKLIGEITWSWLWVLSPLWIGFLLWIVVVVGIVSVVAWVNKPYVKRRK